MAFGVGALEIPLEIPYRTGSGSVCYALYLIPSFFLLLYPYVLGGLALIKRGGPGLRMGVDSMRGIAGYDYVQPYIFY